MIRKNRIRLAVYAEVVLAALWIISPASGNPQQPSGHDTTQGHDAPHSGVNQRGDQVMGFSHEKTTHHFRLKTDGGSIEVEANDPRDTASRDQIRTHLQHIASKFSAGDFNAPMLTESC
ncbi:MAG: hypothetical protein ABI882_23615 [Acidobacteriota bacterium]